MRDRKLMLDKIDKARVKPSTGAWKKIEKGLDQVEQSKKLRIRSLVGWAAAIFIGICAYLVGTRGENSSSYMPETLELNDQAGEMRLPQDFFPLPKNITNYREGGRLVPNYHALWKNPLMPRVKSL